MNPNLAVDVVVVQHGEKERAPGDPGLTDRGFGQAVGVADLLSGQGGVAAVYSSALRRAVDTAVVIATRLGADLYIDDRLRERMNWEGSGAQSFESFLAEWTHTTNDRRYVPSTGDSSQAAGDRFREFLDEVADRYPGRLFVVVSHGGVTVDCLRDLLSDEALRQRAPEIFDAGIPNGGLTRLRRRTSGWEVLTIGDTGHLHRN